MEKARLQKDKRHLLRIFPENVWLLIHGNLIQKLDNQAAVVSLFHASVYFRQLLFPQRNLFLLPSVLKEMFERYHYGPEIKSGYATYSVWLKMRSVCRSWSTTLEKQMPTLHNMHVTPCIIEVPVEDEIKFLSHFEGSHSHKTHNRSPFIGNSFEYKFDGDSVNAGMPFKKLLPKYGHYIHYCYLRFNCYTASKRWIETAAMHLLFWMPNLKKLELTLLIVDDNGDSGNLPIIAELPELLYLTNFSLRMNTKSDIIPSKLLSKISNLRNLDITYWQAIRSSEDLLSGLVSSKLKNLELTLKFGNGYRSQYDKYIMDHPATQQHPCLMDAGLHATLLTLETHSPMKCLRSLKINLKCIVASSWHELEKYTIDLPQLTDLSLSSWTWPCMDIALLFHNSLERLTIKVDTTHTLEEWKQLTGAVELLEREKIKFLSSNVTFDMDSNIWKEIPKLQKVSLEITVAVGKELYTKQFYRNGEVEGFDVSAFFTEHYKNCGTNRFSMFPSESVGLITGGKMIKYILIPCVFALVVWLIVFWLT